MAKGEELFSGEVTVGELIAEEHPDDRSDGEGVENQGLFREHGGQVFGKQIDNARQDGWRFRCRKPQAWQVSKDQRQPSTPNEELQDHHQEESETIAVHG